MCGICGKIAKPAFALSESTLRRMGETMRDRGPDDQGYHLSRDSSGSWSAALGHRRLSIIDLSENGRQPLSNEDGTVWVVFNGEIYNFLDIRKELEAKGHRFRTCTDTEVLVHLYEEMGEKAVSRLSGMFAFAVWDQAQGRLILGRDRAGEKPLFYHAGPEGIGFASSLRALLEDPRVSREPDPRALSLYLRYLCVPSPLTAFQGICKLPPAHIMVWEKGHHRVEPYWELHHGPKWKISEEEAAEELLRLLREAVRARLISDVPLGAFLSGGIDSSAVVALMAGASSKPTQTFSIGFDDGSYDERRYARLVASRFGTDHHEFVVSPRAADILPELVGHFGEPFADASAIPTFYLAHMTRQHVTVALSGDGGDEGFGGYERYVALSLAERLVRLPGFRLLGRGVAAAAHAKGDPRGPVARFGRFCKAVGDFSEPAERYAWLLSGFSESPREVLVNEFAAAEEVEDPVAALVREKMRALGPVEAAMRADFRFYLPEDVLVKVDVASMFHGLEVRCPLLDERVLEFAARLPLAYKVNGRLTKALLKRHVFRAILPDEILHRPKRGFGVPLGKWFRNGLGAMFEERVMNGRGREIVQKGFAGRMLAEHRAGKMERGTLLWALLCLSLWHESFF